MADYVWYLVWHRETQSLLGLIHLFENIQGVYITIIYGLTFSSSMVYGQLSPVCAIVGGVLAQEIIKAVSQKDPPHNNFFFFNTQDGAGVVECIGH